MQHIVQLCKEYLRSTKSGFRSLYSVQKMLSAHYPASDNFWKNAISTIDDVNAFPKQLLALTPQPDTYITCDELFDFLPILGGGPNISLDLVNNAFNKFGSDKAKTGLSPVYQILLGALTHKSSLLEIGIGTNNPNLISSMGKKGIPGASLLAYEHILQNSLIFGADIDPDIMFSTKSIKTTVVDQTSLSTLLALPGIFGVENFDLIIDDGLHSPQANLNSLLFAMKFSKPGGLIWIEDIPRRSLEIWYLVKRLTKDHYAFFEIVKINENGFGVLIRTIS